MELLHSMPRRFSVIPPVIFILLPKLISFIQTHLCVQHFMDRLGAVYLLLNLWSSCMLWRGKEKRERDAESRKIGGRATIKAIEWLEKRKGFCSKEEVDKIIDRVPSMPVLRSSSTISSPERFCSYPIPKLAHHSNFPSFTNTLYSFDLLSSVVSFKHDTIPTPLEALRLLVLYPLFASQHMLSIISSSIDYVSTYVTGILSGSGRSSSLSCGSYVSQGHREDKLIQSLHSTSLLLTHPSIIGLIERIDGAMRVSQDIYGDFRAINSLNQFFLENRRDSDILKKDETIGCCGVENVAITSLSMCIPDVIVARGTSRNVEFATCCVGSVKKIYSNAMNSVRRLQSVFPQTIVHRNLKLVNLWRKRHGKGSKIELETPNTGRIMKYLPKNFVSVSSSIGNFFGVFFSIVLLFISTFFSSTSLFVATQRAISVDSIHQHLQVLSRIIKTKGEEIEESDVTKGIIKVIPQRGDIEEEEKEVLHGLSRIGKSTFHKQVVMASSDPEFISSLTSKQLLTMSPVDRSRFVSAFSTPSILKLPIRNDEIPGLVNLLISLSKLINHNLELLEKKYPEDYPKFLRKKRVNLRPLARISTLFTIFLVWAGWKLIKWIFFSKSM
ncbi:hypothetical protein ADUPG1_008420 [Aduncisulcus paluster]|uniref:Uncharacterized protein n=1 Tax=Aduncisulcus paluster TaxID=2918883 RepID=A0ABQ5KRX6_9EUKA|nr:hypothetical protein ADUPG1_008420 [Aduncisulcus paluster]